MVRLNKYLASVGVASRRGVDALITQGRVTCNGKKVTTLGIMVDPDHDAIAVDGAPVGSVETKTYLLFHKPLGVVSTAHDELNRATVVEAVNAQARVYPVGRLDVDSTGLILLTNDGDLAHKLTHPKFHIPKTYEVTVRGSVSPAKLARLTRGIKLADFITRADGVTVVKTNPRYTLIRITIHEGRNRQIRRMCGALKLEVLALKRIAIGSVALGDLAERQSREVTPKELTALQQAVGEP